MKTASVTLTNHQLDAVGEITSWLDDGAMAVLLGGYAGTGKTVATIAIAKDYSPYFPVVVTAPTNKAVAVLRDKAMQAGGITAEFATVHSILGLEP